METSVLCHEPLVYCVHLVNNVPVMHHVPVMRHVPVVHFMPVVLVSISFQNCRLSVIFYVVRAKFCSIYFAIYPFLPFNRLPFIRVAKVWFPYTQSMGLGNFCHLSVIAI